MKQNYLYQRILGAVIFMGSSQLYAQVTTFSYTGSTEEYVVPLGVESIQIEASGGQGGNGSGGEGGLGATMIGTFSVTPGDVLTIVVGQAGSLYYNAGGGGGGTGVLFGADPLIIAGGGGGAATNEPGMGGVITEEGGSSSGPGGTAGNGGQKGFMDEDCGWSAGGGGFYGDGYGGNDEWDGGVLPGTLIGHGGGRSWAAGGAGGLNGGCTFTYTNMGAWGCGGGGAGAFGGAGGGGYSGGGAGHYTDSDFRRGGAGGGSYNDGIDQVNTPANHAGNGEIIITELCMPLTVTYSSDVICFGDSFTVEASGIGTVTWDGGVENGEPYTPATSGVLTYTATSDDGSECNYIFEIEVLELPTVVAIADETSVCDGESVTLTGGGATTYAWDLGVTNSVAFTPGIGTTTYTVVGTDLDGCENTDEIEITVNVLPEVEASITDNEICIGESVILTGSGATAYSWTPAGIMDGVAFMPDVTGTTTYEVTGTDDNGCIGTATIDLTVYEMITITYTSTEELVGADGSIDITVIGGNPAYMYDWDNDGTGDFDDTQDLTGLAGGSYVVLVNDAAGCEATETIAVNSQLGVNELSAELINVYPNPTSDQLTINLNGNYGYAIYSVSGDLVLTGQGANQSIVDLTPIETGVYILKISAAEKSVSVKITKN